MTQKEIEMRPTIMGIACPGCAPGDFAQPHICGVTATYGNGRTFTSNGTSVNSSGFLCGSCGVMVWQGQAHYCHGYSNLPPEQMTARTPHKCPVCEGRGRVPRDFYGETMNNSAQIVCQSCSGVGVLWS